MVAFNRSAYAADMPHTVNGAARDLHGCACRDELQGDTLTDATTAPATSATLPLDVCMVFPPRIQRRRPHVSRLVVDALFRGGQMHIHRLQGDSSRTRKTVGNEIHATEEPARQALDVSLHLHARLLVEPASWFHLDRGP